MSGIRLKRPYAAIVIVLATLVAALTMATHSDPLFQKVAFVFATVLIGGFGAKASIAVAGGSLKVAVLLIVAVLTMFEVALNFVAPEVFASFVLESTAQVSGGAVVVVVGDLLNRQVSDDIQAPPD